jgi:RNA polymerase sigma factor (sigma-70 family)
MDSFNSDKKLIENILAGNPNEFRVLIDKYKKLVSHIVFRMIANQNDRDELGQEIFIKIYQNLPSFQYKSKLSTWIGRIAYHACLNYLRKKRIPLYEDQISHENGGVPDSQSKISINQVKSQTLTPEKNVSQNQVFSILSSEINKLPIQYRSILSFFHLDDMTIREISEVMKLPEGTVKSYLFRSRKILKDRLLAKYNPEELCL